ncbi:MAG: 3-oxoacyl-(acyl-carrier-protein) synthase 2 [Actinobacteria bacterium]|nr:3-oxoacyl-(acyl-carrier-protein) synthase 2 [Actinomycetota bacterium]
MPRSPQVPERRRIAVTGIGPVTPIGTGVEDFWAAMIAGKSGAGPITRFDATDFKSKVAAEINGFEITDYLPAKNARRLDRFSQLAYAAATLALADARMKPSDPDPARVGMVIGSGIGGIGLWEEEHTAMLKRGPRFVSPSLIAMMIPNAAAGSLAIEFGFTGPNECTVTACASSGHAIARAMDYIRSGAADVVLVGGAESCISPMSVASFCSARALTTRNDDPEHASRPFDRDRDGFVIGEAATVLVFEAMEHARNRGARILAEAIGYGLSSDAYHVVAPHPDGAGASAAMTAALADAQLAPGEVGYINAHATSTELGDASEAKAVRKVFGSQPPPTSATKSMTGHLLGAAGATEAAASILAMLRGKLPPTINYENPDPECDLDVVPNKARDAKVDVVMSNSFGFGGHNVSVLFGRH